jgi:hypothetical protein
MEKNLVTLHFISNLLSLLDRMHEELTLLHRQNFSVEVDLKTGLYS